jgi:hypothetical protein
MASRKSRKLHPCKLMSVVRSHARSKARVAGQIQKLNVVVVVPAHRVEVGVRRD